MEKRKGKKRKHKLIKDINEELWHKFIAYCKIKNIKVSDELNEVLENHLKKNFEKILK
jgi:hypothetical protein